MKQNAGVAHTGLWQVHMDRLFIYFSLVIVSDFGLQSILGTGGMVLYTVCK